MRRAVEIESVGSAHNDVNLSVQVGRKLRPIGLQNMHNVVFLPGLDDLRVNIACSSVEHLHRAAIGPARRKYPFEGGELAAIGTEHFFQMREIFEGRQNLAFISYQRIKRAIRSAIYVCVRSIEIGPGEVMEIAWVGRR